MASTGPKTSTRPEAAQPPRKEERAQAPLAPSSPQLAVAFSQALDLAEGRLAGHAARVCYVALNLAHGVQLPPEQREAVFYGALFHDAGAAPASSEMCRLLNMSEETLFCGRPGQSPHQLAMEISPQRGTEVIELLRSHLELGAQIARELGFDEQICQAIECHHERWDGQGFPHALKGAAIPASGRIVAASDIIESLISAEANPLTARRNLVALLAEHSGRSIDPDLARYARELVRSDTFWLGLHDDDLSAGLAAAIDAPKGDRKRDPLATFATVFAKLADSKGEHTTGHSTRTGEVARGIAERLGFEKERCRRVQLAGLLHDVGLLGVPARVIAKPDILSLTEMEAMRKHPTYSQQVLEGLPGLEDVALWAGAHHERPDGKGYPEFVVSEAIPIEARIIALADTYVALTAERPYRRALSEDDARTVLLGGAGTQLDKRLVQLFCASDVGTTSSRSAPRTARKR